jgi:tetratricopeptide (TPR) repeat protein
MRILLRKVSYVTKENTTRRDFLRKNVDRTKLNKSTFFLPMESVPKRQFGYNGKITFLTQTNLLSRKTKNYITNNRESIFSHACQNLKSTSYNYEKSPSSKNNACDSYRNLSLQTIHRYGLLLILLLVAFLYVYSTWLTSRSQNNSINEEFLIFRDLARAFDLFNRGKNKECIEFLILAARRHKKLIKAIDYLENGELDCFIKIVDDIFINDFKLEDFICVVKGIIFISLEQKQAAMECLDEAVLKGRNNYVKACAYYYRGKLFEILGKKSLAEADFSTAESLDKIVKEFTYDPSEIAKLINIYFSNNSDINIVSIWSRLTKGNRVTVRIWLPNNLLTNVVNGEDASFGHASLQTQKYYASFWPDGSDKEKFNDILDDIQILGLPDVRTNLYTLNVENVNSCYEKFLRDGYNWRLLGKHPSIWSAGFIDAKDQNCAGLCLALLSSGGINNLVKSTFSDTAEKFLGPPLIGALADIFILGPLGIPPVASKLSLGVYYYFVRDLVTPGSIRDLTNKAKKEENKKIESFINDINKVKKEENEKLRIPTISKHI